MEMGTIEDQMKNVEKIVKECDQARKQLDQLVHRLDELYDEVKRYKDFLGYEKIRRDPGTYKSSSSSSSSTSTAQNSQVTATFGVLTTQLVQEWEDKLKNIRGNLQASAIPLQET